MATAGDLITASFLKIGVDSPSSNQTASALISLNNMISSWGGQQLYPSLTREQFTLTIGDAEYTIGPSGDMNTVRPIKIENAFLRDSESYDTPLGIFAAKDYNKILYKNVHARPSKLYFIPEVTLAKIIFDSEPDAAYTFCVESWKNFTEFSLTTTTSTLPNEYKEALVYNLAVSLAEDWDRVPSKSVLMRAEETKWILSAANAATRPVPLAEFDLLLGSSYNISTDS
jgi:hypothetical protein